MLAWNQHLSLQFITAIILIRSKDTLIYFALPYKSNDESLSIFAKLKFYLVIIPTDELED